MATTGPLIKSVGLPNGMTLPYVEQGDPTGVPVLFLHGFADSWRSFGLVLPHLPNSIHALALTLRGHGDASRPVTGYSIRDFAGDIAQFQEATNLRAQVIVGHSMGAAVALRFAIDRPERVLGLVLVGASPSMEGTAAAREFWNSTLAKLTDPIDPTFVRTMTESSLAQAVPQSFVDAAIQDSLKVPAFVWKAAIESRWNLEGDYASELGRIRTPTLIVWGGRDGRYSRLEQERLVSAIAGSRLIAYRRAGHVLHWEEPQRFASDLVTFVGGLPNR